MRVDGLGQVTEAGVLLGERRRRDDPNPRVGSRHDGETIRDALFRHLEKDLGPMAFPQLPASPVVAVAEYFPLPGISPFTDQRQHAVSLAYACR